MRHLGVGTPLSEHSGHLSKLQITVFKPSLSERAPLLKRNMMVVQFLESSVVFAFLAGNLTFALFVSMRVKDPFHISNSIMETVALTMLFCVSSIEFLSASSVCYILLSFCGTIVGTSAFFHSE